MGGIVEKIAPTLHVDAADTLDDGPWEEAGANSMTGELYFLNGDRFLEVNYLTSTTDMNGAVGLSRIALGRLGSGEKTPAASAAARKTTNGCPAVEQVGRPRVSRSPSRSRSAHRRIAGRSATTR